MRRYKRTIACLAIVFVILAVFLLGTAGKRQNLFANATLIADTHDWTYNTWIDERTLLVVANPVGRPVEAFTLDSVSGHRQPLAGLTKTLTQFDKDTLLRFSPDGRWVVASEWIKHPNVRLLISTGDGRIVIRSDSRPVWRWLSDSSGWLAFRGKKDRTQRLYGTDGSIRNYPTPPQGSKGIVLGITSSQTVLLGEYNPYSRDPVQIQTIDLQAGKLVTVTKVGLPPGCLPSELDMSPDCTKLSWQVRPHPGLLTSLLAFIRPDAWNDVWISRADGSDMRLIGGTEVKYGYDYDTNLQVQWIPGVKALAVGLGRKLYRVPVSK